MHPEMRPKNPVSATREDSGKKERSGTFPPNSPLSAPLQASCRQTVRATAVSFQVGATPTRGRLNERLLLRHWALTGCRSESTPFCSLSGVQSRVSVNNEIEDRGKWNTGQMELKQHGTGALKKNCLSCVLGDQEEIHTEGDSWSLGKISRGRQSRNGILGWENHRSGDNVF